MKVPGEKRPAAGVAPVAAQPAGHCSWNSRNRDRSRVQQQQWHELPAAASPRSLQISDRDATTAPFVDILLYLEAKGGAACVGSYCKELEDSLVLHGQDVKGSRRRDTVKVSL